MTEKVLLLCFLSKLVVKHKIADRLEIDAKPAILALGSLIIGSHISSSRKNQ